MTALAPPTVLVTLGHQPNMLADVAFKEFRNSRAEASGQEVAVVNPLENQAWDELLARHPKSTFFHGASWAQVLHRTYGHRPVYFCRGESGRLHDLLPVMEVASPWTGRRGVSLPFTDFCSPLASKDQAGPRLHESALRLGSERRWKYLECRGGVDHWPGASPSLTFHGHCVELNHSQDQLWANLASAVRRGIRKALQAGMQVEVSCQPDAMRNFYQLHCLTRRRHGLPPQPWRFFENIARYVFAKGHGFVTMARGGNQLAAAAVFFQMGREVIYKFGASDFAHQQSRPNNLVMWETIKRCAEEGFVSLHLGRTSLNNPGLRRFKLGFGAREECIEYCRYDFVRRAFVGGVDRAQGWFNRVFRGLPLPLLRIAGRILYPHLS